MRLGKQLRLGIRSIVRRARMDRELEEELHYHLELQIEEYIAAGLSPDDARREALQSMEGVQQKKEECRDMRSTAFIEHFLKDAGYALRMMRRSPGFTAIVVLTLALGIGANTAIFSLIDRLLVRPFPWPEPDRLVTIGEVNSHGGDMSVSWLDFTDWRDESRAFTAMAAVQSRNGVFVHDGSAQTAAVLKVSASFFPMLGVHPVLGRDFTASDDRPGAAAVALLSHSIWQQRFGSDPHVTGTAIRLDGQAYTVAGVLPRSFRLIGPADIFLPIGLDPASMGSRGNHPGILVAARLKPRVSLASADREMKTIAARLERQYPASNDGISVRLRPLTELISGQVRRSLMALWGAVALVLLIACANVANLLLARAVAREREMAIRVAIGAGQGRLLRQLLTESVLLALTGAAGGLVIARAALPLILRLLPAELADFAKPRIDVRVLCFTFALAVLTTVLFGLAPGLQAARRDPDQVLRSGRRGAPTGFRGISLRATLVSGQMALAFMLLAGAGILIESLMHLARVNPGFRTDSVLTMRLYLPRAQYRKVEQQTAFVDKLLTNVRALPGVASASGAYCLPLDVNGCWSSVFVIEGRPMPRAQDLPSSRFNAIEPGWLQTMTIPLIRGRDFTWRDTAGTEPVLMVNESFARRFFPREDPLGKRVKQDFPEGKSPYYTIVGIMGDVRRDRLDQPPEPEAFEAIRQIGPDFINLVIRTSLPNPMALSSAVRHAAARIDPGIPLFDMRTMEYYVAEQESSRRFPMLLLMTFAGIALALASIGLYGLLSFIVTQRRQELGIRIALGARSGDITRIVMHQGGRLVAAGLLAGLTGAWAGSRLLDSLLFGVRPNDPGILATVACLLVLIAALACWLPSRRAARLDPAVTLRAD